MLAAEKRGRSGAEPSGAPETLAGRLSKMGDRVSFAKPDKPGGSADDEAAKRKKQRRGGASNAGDGIDYDLTVARGKVGGGGDQGGGGGGFLDAAAAAGSYVPRTRATADAFAALLSVVRSQFGDQPADVLHGAAEEVLAVLKDDSRPESSKKGEVEALVGELGPERFAQVVALGRLVTDFVPADLLDVEGAQGVFGGDAALAAAAAAANDDGDGGLDDEIGVAVEFEGESSDDNDGGGGGGLRGGEATEVVEVETEDDDDEAGAAVRVGGGGRGEVGAGPADPASTSDASSVAAHDIDAHWLQRRVSSSFAGALDASAAQQLADRAYALLADASLPDREAENALVALLDFDKFDLVRALLKDRAKIVWCVALARARSAGDRAAVEAAAAASEGGAEVLAELAAASRLSAKDRQAAAERKIREEARAINGGGEGGEADDDGGAGPSAAAALSRRHEIDLDSLAFTAGAHTMTNKRCDLPPGSYRTAFKGYEEVHVPAPAPPAFSAGEKLVPVEQLPSWARPAFAGMKSLNRIQSRVCDAALYGSGNLLMCAPTGAGKTNVAMLTMLQVIGLHRKKDKGKKDGAEGDGEGEGKPSSSSSPVSVDTSAFKIVYVAPMKALVSEQVANFSKRLAPYGISVRELTVRCFFFFFF